MNILTTIKSFFNSKKSNPKYTKDLIYIDSGHIHFDRSEEFVQKTEKAMNEILRYNNIFEDKAYFKLYSEYQKHYVIYDANPILIFCKIPIILSADYEDLHVLNPKEMLDLMIPTIEDLALLDNRFKMPEFLRNTLVELYDKTSYYFNKNRSLEKSEFIRLIHYNYLKEWDYFYSQKESVFSHRLSLFLSSQSRILAGMGGEDNSRIIINVIDRCLGEKVNIEKAKEEVKCNQKD